MKTKAAILALFIILSCNGLLSAQTEKGTFLIGESFTVDLGGGFAPSNMNLGWGTYKTKSDSEGNTYSSKGFSLNLTPRLGYFVASNLVVGIDFGILNSKYTSDDGDYISKWSQFTTGPFLRYYIPTQKLLPYAEANYGIGSSKHGSESGGSEQVSKYHNQLFGFGIGLGVPLGEKVTFDTLLGYQSYMYKAKEDNDDNLRSILGTFGLKLGVTILL